MIPAFLINKLVSRILSHVLERTDEHHNRFQEKLEFLENELTDLKQNNEIQFLKTNIQQNELPSITIDHITIENVHIVTSELPSHLFQQNNDRTSRPVNHNGPPKINIKKRNG